MDIIDRIVTDGKILVKLRTRLFCLIRRHSGGAGVRVFVSRILDDGLPGRRAAYGILYHFYLAIWRVDHFL